MVINTPDSLSSNREMSLNNGTTKDKKTLETTSNNSGGNVGEKLEIEVDESIASNTTWEEMTLANEIEDIVPATESEVKKVKRLLEIIISKLQILTSGKM